MASVGTRIVGESGNQYVIERLLQEKKPPDIRVCLANNRTEKFILKSVHNFDYYHDDSITAFLKHINVLWNGFDETTPCEPFALWKGVDPVIKDSIAGLTDIDPKKRLTAQEILNHSWFQGVKD
ncbi:hypothetical protein TMEN_4607 [Trichophyton mentagrophytes]|uniref:Protein kinase domain-containing protein n=1 Tax=Trichophyton interdigitale (strain MR816) TaxID=1215338 RepID=A0A059J183_TRIIM|nr:hypothetical protein H101_06537 [Trichophyton interdigitale H6]KDB21636.1 hypothetical protein H109_06427 [Trichophyton interdigitale MR816]GBF62076.1 hypothetical protein TMEN_4607 [Trichophyton mentagrophytes]